MNPSPSELILNIDTWQGGRLQPHVDTARYTCASSNNREGPGVNSTTLFRFRKINISEVTFTIHCRVHFPPKNIRISPPIQTVKETLKPRDFYCTAEVTLF